MKRGSASFEQWVDRAIDPQDDQEETDWDAERDSVNEQAMENK